MSRTVYVKIVIGDVMVVMEDQIQIAQLVQMVMNLINRMNVFLNV
jgi:hypothetical protein